MVNRATRYSRRDFASGIARDDGRPDLQTKKDEDPKEITKSHDALIETVNQHSGIPICEIVAQARFQEALTKNGKHGLNILHSAVQDETYAEQPEDNPDSLVEWLALYHPELLDQYDKFGRTPVHLAVESGGHYLRSLLNLLRDLDDLFDLQPSSNLETKMNAQCEYQLYPEGLECRYSWKRLLQGVPKATSSHLITMLVENIHDTKCLHEALKDAECKKTLQLLCDFRLNFQYAVQGRSRDNRTRKNCLHQLLEDEEMVWDSDKGVDFVRDLIKVGGAEMLGHRDETGEFPIHKAVRLKPLPCGLIEVLSQAYPKAVFQEENGINSAYRCLRDSETSIQTEMDEKDEIIRMLKCLCLQDHQDRPDSDEVRKKLYGGMKSFPRMVLDVHAENQPVDWKYMSFLTKNLGVEFDSVLAYVSLPRWPSVPQARNWPKNEETLGERKHTCWGPYQEVFQWLSDTHVKRILKVKVDDMGELPHSDEGIISCLEEFDVKELDWGKIDLCSDTICRAAKDVEALTLHASGKNSALLGWSCKHGLNQLEKLKRVDIHVEMGTESTSTIEAYVNKFIQRINDRRQKAGRVALVIEPHYPTGQMQRGIRRAPHGRVGSTRNSNKWVSHMDKFTNCIANCVVSLPSDIKRPSVKVAIIDDGIHTGHLNFNVDAGFSFWRDDFNHNFKDFWVDPGGHGTRMAGYITKICPMARLFIGRLFDLPTPDGKRSFTADSAAKAIEWAVDQDVDIISMSWSIRSRGTNDDDIKMLENSIISARGQGVLMFASLSDEQPLPDKDVYPARMKKSVFSIGAATPEGDPFPGINVEDADFIFPGVDIPDEYSDKEVLLKGSSIATALAAGLAALLMYCARLAEKQSISEDDMIRMFENLGKGGKNSRFPQVWDTLEAFNSAHPQGLQAVHGIIQRLYRK